MARVGPKKNFEVHFRVSDSEGARLDALCARLACDRSTAARDAVTFFLKLSESRPELTGPHLSVFMLDALARTLSPPVSSPAQGASSRSRSDTKRHK